MITRRGFIQGLVTLVAAPAVIKVSTLMPVKVMPPEPVLQEMRRGGVNLAALREAWLPGLRRLEGQLYDSTPWEYTKLGWEPPK